MNLILNLMDTKYGVLEGVISLELYESGKVKECSTDRHNRLHTPVGILVPQYSNEGVRNKYIKTLSFYENGNLKKAALNEQCIAATDIGPMKAELITFYESGKIKRIFPLNGKITGYWTEENEYELAEPQLFHFPFGNLKKKVINILFYETGNIKSLTFWPKELTFLSTPAGKLGIRYGMGLYPDGRMKSCEPAYPVLVDTPIGKLTAFDAGALGINGDKNSLGFYEDGNIKSVVTSTDSIGLTGINGECILFEPGLRPSMLDEDGMDIIPLKIEFFENKIRINENINYIYDINEYTFSITNKTLKTTSKCGNCSVCSGCR